MKKLDSLTKLSRQMNDIARPFADLKSVQERFGL